MLTQAAVARLSDSSLSRIVVALSGGVDSVVLLHMVRSLQLTTPLHVVHINHGLQSEADSWQHFCESLCRDWGLPLVCFSPDVSKQGSLEEQARLARYEIFTDHLAENELLLMAHHADDQLESVLLNLFRGSEVIGVRGMPRERQIGVGVLYRPLLDLRRDTILRYAEQHQLAWLDDSSNLDLTHDRNFVRHELLPRIQLRFPSSSKAILNATGRDAVARKMIHELARTELERVVLPGDCLDLESILSADYPRQILLLREFINSYGIPMPRTVALQDFLANLERRAALQWAGFQLQVFDGKIFLLKATDISDERLEAPLPGENRFAGGNLLIRLVEGQGLRVDPEVSIQVRTRGGGERLQLASKRTVRNLLQEARVPTWLRRQIPLIYIDNELVAVAGIPSRNIEAIQARGAEVQAGEIGWVFDFDPMERLQS